MAYRVELAPAAVRDFKALTPAIQRRLRPKIDALAKNPRPRGAKKLSDSGSLYRLRAGDYRIIYQVKDKKLVVLLIKIRHRREAYQ